MLNVSVIIYVQMRLLIYICGRCFACGSTQFDDQLNVVDDDDEEEETV